MPNQIGSFGSGRSKLLSFAAIGFLVVSLFAITVTVNDPLKQQILSTYAKEKEKVKSRAQNYQDWASNRIRRLERQSKGACDGAACVADEVLKNSKGTAGIVKPSAQQLAEQAIINQYVSAAKSGDKNALDALKKNNTTLYNQVVADQAAAAQSAAQYQQNYANAVRREQSLYYQSAVQNNDDAALAWLKANSPSLYGQALLDRQGYIAEQQRLQANTTVSTSLEKTDEGFIRTYTYITRDSTGSVVKAVSIPTTSETKSVFKLGPSGFIRVDTTVVKNAETGAVLDTVTSEDYLPPPPEASAALQRFRQYGGNVNYTPEEVKAVSNFCAQAGGDFATCGNVAKFSKDFLNMNPVVVTDPKTGEQVTIPAPDLSGKINLSDLPALAASIPEGYDYRRSTTPYYAACHGDIECDITMQGAHNGLSKLPGFLNYEKAFNPSNITYIWQAAGYKSINECQKALGPSKSSCGGISLTKDQITSSIGLGTTLTTIGGIGAGIGGAVIAGGSAIAAGAGLLGTVGAVGGSVFSTVGAVTTMQQTFTALNAQIEAPGSDQAWNQTAMAGLSWLNLGSADYLIKTFQAVEAGTATVKAVNFARGLNTGVSGINLAVDVPNAISTCKQANAGDCRWAWGAVIADVGFGFMDYRQGQLSFGANPLERVNQSGLARTAAQGDLDQLAKLEDGAKKPATAADILIPGGEKAVRDEQLALLKSKFENGLISASEGQISVSTGDRTMTLDEWNALHDEGITSTAREAGLTPANNPAGQLVDNGHLLAQEDVGSVSDVYTPKESEQITNALAGDPAALVGKEAPSLAGADGHVQDAITGGKDMASDLALSKPEAPTQVLATEPLTADAKAKIIQKTAEQLPNDGASPEVTFNKLKQNGMPESEITVFDIEETNRIAGQKLAAAPVAQAPKAGAITGNNTAPSLVQRIQETLFGKPKTEANPVQPIPKPAQAVSPLAQANEWFTTKVKEPVTDAWTKFVYGDPNNPSRSGIVVTDTEADVNVKDSPIAKVNDQVQKITKPKSSVPTVRDPASEAVIKKYSGAGTASEKLYASEGYRKDPEQIWLYSPGGKAQQYPIEVTLPNGQRATAVYKVHVTTTMENFDEVLERTTAYLRELDIEHKVAPGPYFVDPRVKTAQFGKAITIYAEDPETLRLITNKMQELAGDGLKGIPFDRLKSKGANLQYELPVPGTNNLLYYTIEQINGNGIPYPARAKYMTALFGQGPLDYIWLKKPPTFIKTVVPTLFNQVANFASDRTVLSILTGGALVGPFINNLNRIFNDLDLSNITIVVANPSSSTGSQNVVSTPTSPVTDSLPQLQSTPTQLAPTPISPPPGLTTVGEGFCELNTSTGTYCDGTRMFELYSWYKEQPNAWWYTQTGGEFTVYDFLAIMLIGEETGARNPETLKAVATAVANQLWLSSPENNRPGYCTTPDCEAGILNFLGAYSQSAGERYNAMGQFYMLRVPGDTMNNMLEGNDKIWAEIFAAQGLSLDEIAKITQKPSGDSVDYLDLPTEWGCRGCNDPGLKWIVNFDEFNGKTGTTDPCGVFYDGDGEVVYTLRQAATWAKNPGSCK